MEITQVKEIRFHRKRLRRLLWILVPFLFVLPILLAPFDLIPDIVALVLFFFGITDLIFLFITAEKYYNWPLVFFFIFFTGIFFKRQHWMFATILGSIAIF